MIQNSMHLAKLACGVVIVAGAISRLPAEPLLADETIVTKTNFAQLEPFISGSERVGVSVDLEGEVLCVNQAQDQVVLQMDGGALRVMDLSGQPVLTPGQRVRLTGQGMARQGCLDQVLVDNDGIHSTTEKFGTVYLTAGRHPIRAEWFNGSADYFFEVEYAGPNLKRQRIPDNVLYRMETNQSGGEQNWLPGLSYRCYLGNWKWLPRWQELVPAKTGNVANFDLGVRTRDEDVALQFTGYLQVDRDGVYMFWTKSDDGSRLLVENSPLRLQVLGSLPLPRPRFIKPGQALKPTEDSFWAMVEGVVTAIHIDPGGALEVELCAGSNRMYLVSNAADFHPPGLFSRIRATGLCCSTRLAGGGCVAGRLLVFGSMVEELAPAPTSLENPVTTVAELRRLTAGAQWAGSLLCLTGTVVTGVSPQGCFAFQDETGGVIIQMSRQSDWIGPGQQIVLKGNGFLDGNKLILDHAALVDNDGVHVTTEGTAAAYLTAGRHPIHVSWFNRYGASDLEIYYQGPGLSRRLIPDSALVHLEVDPASGDVKWVPGLGFMCYNGDWYSVPKVSELKLLEMGTTNNFEIQAVNRAEKVGLEFGGYLEVAQAGLYSFSVFSDDGSLLFIDEQVPQIERVSAQGVPEPFPIVARHVLGPEQNNRWSETRGKVKFVSERAGSLFLDLDSVYGPMTVEVVDGSGGSPLLLLGAQVRVRGFCQGALAPDGQSLAANMVVPGMEQVQLMDADPEQWNRYPLEPIGDVVKKDFLSTDEAIVHVQGEAQVEQFPQGLLLKDASGEIEVETAQPLTTNLTGTVDVIGRLSHAETNVLLQCGIYRDLKDEQDRSSKKLPLLTTVQEIKELTREQAWHRYPVKVRGVITLVRDHGCGVIIQDDTAAIDVWWPPYSTTSLPKVGDYWEIEGETSVKFSPIIESDRAVRLGSGAMPAPLQPAWDQLLNGSLDTRYVEIQGIVTATEDGVVTLFTRTGKMQVLLSPLPTQSLKSFENARVRIRGCVVPIRDEQSQQVRVGRFRLSNMSLNVDEPAPPDLFDVGLKHVSELLLFDAQADTLRRVKIAGQILHEHDRDLFLADGTNTIRVVAREPVSLRVGDLVETVGFLELNDGAPVLHEATLRRTGWAPLPEPVHISGSSLLTSAQDGRLVSVEARLIGVSSEMSDKLLELRAGNREFFARLENHADLLMELSPGSLLELTGVCSAQGARPPSGKGFSSFELLLNSSLAVKVLERPPWWTLQRALIFVGGMSLVILATAFWIVLLRRRVEERTVQLGIEIHHRERFQRQNELAKERSRIAQDMHDQLGANVTKVGLLAELTKKNIGDSDKVLANAERISKTAFELGRGLDEIVWAVNPKNDSLNNFCDYVAVQAQELFQLTDILCRVDLPPEMLYYPLCAEVRHNLFLAAKEALNNVVRHANAREVWMRFKLEDSKFTISIVDDGNGFAPEQTQSLRNGLKIMQKRLEDAGGCFTIVSQPNHGTEVIFAISLARMAGKIDGGI